MNTLLVILAAGGAAAAAWHAVSAALRFLRRGDLSRARTRAGAEALGWLILLIVPALTPWSGRIYAAYIVLWLVPALRGRRR